MLCDKCHATNVRPIVALDVDGTISDYHGSFINFVGRWKRRAIQETNELIQTFDGSVGLAEHLGLEQKEYREIKLAYRQGGGKRFQPALGDVRGLAEGLVASGVDIWITTTRPYLRHDSTDPDTRDWLDTHLGEGVWQGLIYDEDKYDRLANLVDPGRVVMVLDDLPEQCDEAAQLGFNVIQRRTPYNRGAQWQRGTSSLMAAYAYVMEELDQWTQR